MNNVGIFIFVGLLSVLFHEQGWFPNENMCPFSGVYRWILPTLMAFEGGRLICGKEAMCQAVSGVFGSRWHDDKDTDAGIFAAMIIAGPAAGSLWKLVDKRSGSR